MHDSPALTITQLSADDLPAHITELGALLHACVHGGASIGFILPYTITDAKLYWTSKVQPALKNGKLILLIAMTNGRIAGTIQLDYDTMPNQPQRAEVRKVLVHPDFRRQGIAKMLMSEIETIARSMNRTLLTLDTRTGDGGEPLYNALGFQTLGVIPNYCINPISGDWESATFMYKAL